MEWNYNIDEAQKGEYITQTRVRKGKEEEYSVFLPEKILAAEKGGGLVIVTNWMPKEGRWHMFAIGEAPLCWSHWPEHPEKSIS